MLGEYHYEIKNKKLKRMVEKKAKSIGMTTEQLIWCYINRGLMNDGFNDDVFWELHSEKHLKEVNEALGLD